MSKSTWRDDGRGYARIRYLVRVTDRPGGSAHWLTKQRHARVLVFAPAGRRTSRSGTQAILKSWWKSHLLPGWQRKVAFSGRLVGMNEIGPVTADRKGLATLLGSAQCFGRIRAGIA